MICLAYIKSFKEQSWLLPPNITEMIPKDHVCFLIEAFVDEQDFTSFDIKYSGAGHPAYHPRIILKLLIMGILDKIRSSRRLARNSKENIVYIYLSEKISPDFRTISDFRKNNPKIIKQIFQHTVSLAKSEGMLDLSHLATDGTKLKANASNRKVLLKEELEFLLNFVTEELDNWSKQDSIENDFFKEVRGNDQLPKSSKKRMRNAVKHYIAELKEKGDYFKINLLNNLKNARSELLNNNLKKVNVTDPESRFMLSKKGKIEFLYNPQITTEKNGFIIANDVCNKANDIDQLKPQVIQTIENLKEIPDNVKWSFDKGYMEGSNIHFLNSHNIDAYIACQKNPENNFYGKHNFKYNREKDRYICPDNKILIFKSEGYDKTKRKNIKLYKGISCETCKNQNKCTKRKDGIRVIKKFDFEEDMEYMKKKMKTKEAKEIYRFRKQIVEFVFGDIKENKGIISFLTKSLETVKTEFNLISIANNLSKIWKIRLDKIRILEKIKFNLRKSICILY